MLDTKVFIYIYLLYETSLMVRSHQQIETDKMATVRNGIGVPVQYEHLHTIISLPFLPSADEVVER